MPASKQSISDADIGLRTGFKSYIRIIDVKERKFHVTFALGNKCQGTKVPGNTNSTYGTWERKFSGTKVARVSQYPMKVLLHSIHLDNYYIHLVTISPKTDDLYPKWK